MPAPSPKSSGMNAPAPLAANATATGLEGVVVADTRLSDVDGERGRLVIAGHDVESLATRTPFEGVCALLWGRDEASVREALGRGRARAWPKLGVLGDALEAADGMEALRAAMAHLPASQFPHDAHAAGGRGGLTSGRPSSPTAPPWRAPPPSSLRRGVGGARGCRRWRPTPGWATPKT